MNLTIIIIVMIVITIAMGFITLAVTFANNMTFDEVVDDTADLVKTIPNQSSRVVTQLIPGGP